MTCIVGIEDGDRVVIGADAAGSEGWRVGTRADVKAWTSGSFAYGYTTSFRMGQLLQHKLTFPTDMLPRSNADDAGADRFMATRFIDKVRRVLKDGGFLSIENGREEGGTLLVGFRRRLYAVGDDLQIARYGRGEYAVGAGADLALGALYATSASAGDVNLSAEDRALLALQASSEWSGAVRGPFTIVDTKGGCNVIDA